MNFQLMEVTCHLLYVQVDSKRHLHYSGTSTSPNQPKSPVLFQLSLCFLHLYRDVECFLHLYRDVECWPSHVPDDELFTYSSATKIEVEKQNIPWSASQKTWISSLTLRNVWRGRATSPRSIGTCGIILGLRTWPNPFLQNPWFASPALPCHET